MGDFQAALGACVMLLPREPAHTSWHIHSQGSQVHAPVGGARTCAISFSSNCISSKCLHLVRMQPLAIVGSSQLL